MKRKSTEFKNTPYVALKAKDYQNMRALGLTESEYRRRKDNAHNLGSLVKGAAVAGVAGLIAAVATGNTDTEPTDTSASTEVTTPETVTYFTPQEGLRIRFEEGETPDSEALAVAGIDPKQIDQASPAQRQIYAQTKGAIVDALHARGIEDMSRIPIGTELHMGDPNME